MALPYILIWASGTEVVENGQKSSAEQLLEYSPEPIYRQRCILLKLEPLFFFHHDESRDTSQLLR